MLYIIHKFQIINTNLADNFAVNNIGSYVDTELSANSSSGVYFNEKLIGISNSGNFLIIPLAQTSSSVGYCGIWLAHITSNASDSYVVELMAGASNMRPTLRLTGSGNLQVTNKTSATVVTRCLIFKM